jgi:hypothetical protein
MKTTNAETFFEAKDTYGNEYICPFTDGQADRSAGKIPGNECFEKDVMERYAGNIDIVGRDA